MASQTQRDAKYAKQGWLTKRGGFRKNWLPRYMVLDPVQKTFSYYETEASTVPKGVIKV